MAIGNFPGTVTMIDPPREQGVLTSTGMKYGNFNRSIAGNTMMNAGAGFSSGSGRGGSRFGSPFPGRPRIGSAAGPLGSGGIPTSARGRAEKFGEEAAMMPAWAVSEAVREAPGVNGMSAGLSQSQRFGGMGGLPDPTAQGAPPAPPQPRPSMPSSTAFPITGGRSLTRPGSAMWPRPIGSFARGTSSPIPHGHPFIAGDSTNGKPNEELILPTERGIEVLPLDKMPRLAAGTTPRASKPPPVPLPAPKRPTHGMDDFYRLNPNTPPAYQKESEKLIMNPRLPMPIRVPKLAKGTVNDPETAFDALYADGALSPPAPVALPAAAVAPQFHDGDVRQDAMGNDWRYSAALRQGVPDNQYLLHPNSPSPNAFKATPAQRYNDLAQRLSGLRQEGMSRGRASVAAIQARQQAEEAAQRLLEAERVRTNLPGGGQGIVGRYGRATIGRNMPKSFTVERMDGTSGRYNNLAEADVESRADAAQRHVEGVPMNTGRGVGAGVPAPTALQELTGVDEAALVLPLPEDRPSTAESRRRRWGMNVKLPAGRSIAMPASPPSALDEIAGLDVEPPVDDLDARLAYEQRKVERYQAETAAAQKKREEEAARLAATRAKLREINHLRSRQSQYRPFEAMAGSFAQ